MELRTGLFHPIGEWWRRFWRTGCRPWMRRRNIPYFVLLAMVAFLIAGRIAAERRRAPQALPAGQPAASPVPARTAQPLSLSQAPDALGAAWQAMSAEDGNHQAGISAIALDPASFTPPCQGTFLKGRGWERMDETGTWVYHRGVDLGVDPGQAVAAVAAGTVAKIGPDEEGGTRIEIDHGAGWRSVYGRLERVSVQEGARVAGGEKLGFAGDGGVHFEIWQKTPLDPVSVLPGMVLE